MELYSHRTLREAQLQIVTNKALLQGTGMFTAIGATMIPRLAETPETSLATFFGVLAIGACGIPAALYKDPAKIQRLEIANDSLHISTQTPLGTKDVALDLESLELTLVESKSGEPKYILAKTADQAVKLGQHMDAFRMKTAFAHLNDTHNHWKTCNARTHAEVSNTAQQFARPIF